MVRRLQQWTSRAALAAALALGVALPAPPAQAQSDAELDKARATYKQGLSLEAAGDWAAALEKFEEVAKVRTTPQVRFHIARCKENLGRLTEALGDYRVAEYEATQQKVKEADEIAAAREALEAKVPKLVISKGGTKRKPRVVLDGVQLGQSKLEQPFNVDPGQHTIIVKWKGGKRSEQTITVAEGETKKIELEAPPGVDSPGAAADEADPDEPDADESDGTAKPPGADKPPADDGGSVLPWVVGGIGVAGLIAGGVFVGLRSSAENELNSKCRANICPPSLEATQKNGETYSMLANVSLGIGAAGIIGAIVLLMVEGPSTPEKPAAPAAEPAPPAAEGAWRSLRFDVLTGPTHTGVNVVGRF